MRFAVVHRQMRHGKHLTLGAAGIVKFKLAQYAYAGLLHSLRGQGPGGIHKAPHTAVAEAAGDDVGGHRADLRRTTEPALTTTTTAMTGRDRVWTSMTWSSATAAAKPQRYGKTAFTDWKPWNVFARIRTAPA